MRIPAQIPMYQTVTATLAAALIAGAIVGFPGLPHATDTSPMTAAPPPVATPPAGDQGTARGWPYSHPPGQIRLITTDQLP